MIKISKKYLCSFRDDCPAKSASEIKQLLKYLVKTLDLQKISGEALEYAKKFPEYNELHEKFVKYYGGEL